MCTGTLGSSTSIRTLGKQSSYSYLGEAAILKLLAQHPVDGLLQVVGVDVDERLRLRERLEHEACQPHATRVVVVAESAVRAVRVTIRQLPLVA